MRGATKILLFAAATLALAGCHKQPPQNQNIIVDNNLPANADVEALPQDESSEISSNELANGDDNPDVNDLNASSNSY
jgi:uncharacterized lipoprotein YajG